MEAPSADPYHPSSLPSCNHLIFTFRSVAISDTRYGSRRINLGMAAQAYLASNPYPPSGRQAGSFYVTFWKSKGGGWEKQRTLSSLAASHESRRHQETEMRAQQGGAYYLLDLYPPASSLMIRLNLSSRKPLRVAARRCAAFEPIK